MPFPSQEQLERERKHLRRVSISAKYTSHTLPLGTLNLYVYNYYDHKEHQWSWSWRCGALTGPSYGTMEEAKAHGAIEAEKVLSEASERIQPIALRAREYLNEVTP